MRRLLNKLGLNDDPTDSNPNMRSEMPKSIYMKLKVPPEHRDEVRFEARTIQSRHTGDWMRVSPRESTDSGEVTLDIPVGHLSIADGQIRAELRIVPKNGD